MNKKVVTTIISILLLIIITCVVVYFSVPQVKDWVNGIFTPNTEQPDTPTDSSKPETPTDITYTVTDTTITITPIANAEYLLAGGYTTWQDSNVFEGLQPATQYTIYVRIKATDTAPASDSAILQITTDKSTQAAPMLADITYSSTSNRITITTKILGLEYSIDNGSNWQDSNGFYNLEYDTNYTILIRYKETATHYASEYVSVTAKTTKQERDQKPIMSIQSVTSNKIIVSSSTLYDTEYSIDNGDTWQDSAAFDNLTPSTSYTIMCRYKETDEYEASATVQVTTQTLDMVNAGLFDNEGGLVYSWQQLIDNDAILVTDGVLDGGARTDRLSGNLVIDSSISSIADWAFRNTELTSVTIPAGVTSIGDGAFYLSDNLYSLEFMPNSNLKSIGAQAFDSTRLTELNLPDTVQTIGERAFQGITIDELYIPASLESVTNVFVSMGIKTITVSPNNEYYQVLDGVLFNKEGTELVLYPNDNERIAYTVPSSVLSIDNSAFNGCTNLEEITMPENLSNIASDVFFGCSKLESIYVPDNFVELYKSKLVDFADKIKPISEKV